MKILLCLGPICSGKSTWTKKFIKNNRDWYRFSIDDFKIMSSGWLSNDVAIVDAISSIVSTWATKIGESGGNLIIDGYFLNIDKIESLLKLSEELKILIFDSPLHICQTRNIIRSKNDSFSISNDTVTKFHESFKRFLFSEEFEKFVSGNSVTVVKINELQNSSINN